MLRYDLLVSLLAISDQLLDSLAVFLGFEFRLGRKSTDNHIISSKILVASRASVA